MSSISEGDFTLMIGINVSIIHWFAQSHFQLLKRKSISPTSSQRPSKSCESVVKLLLYSISCSERKSKTDMHSVGFRFLRKSENRNELTEVIGGHSSWYGFLLPGLLNACSWMRTNFGLLWACKRCSATRLLNAPASICVSCGMNEKLSSVSFGKGGNAPPLLQQYKTKEWMTHTQSAND